MSPSIITLDTIKSGLWMSKGENPFWVKVIGDQVFWLGMNKHTDEVPNGSKWCHVGHRSIKGNLIYFNWSYIPVGKDQMYGAITIKIINSSTMKVIENSGNFGKSKWQWVSKKKNFNELKANN
ncbi:hypothetical protein [Arenibacter sp. F20364]|uniref:hypothetical protein n=1 Tax=Arenibacter sp. F20364 TaxID=2926415 RepID=UPI001FF0FE09|nr:hypothetical protein [Arenibacter sp. F20364]MCK0192589.1 hypothetical protein [Arenibacter sp. F20364]